MKLVVIEAPAKRDTLKKYLGAGFEVFATKGHIRDLPVKAFGIDMRNNFEPKYEIMPEKKSLIAELKKKAQNADEVLIATDPDREGEAISWHIAYVLGFDPNKKCRIEFNEISQKAVQKAISQPRVIDQKLVDAQQARRVLDRIVGYKLSPIICKRIHPKISAGRVQSVALKLVVDREKEIENFKPEEYWNIGAELVKDKQKFKAPLVNKKGKKYIPKNKEEADAVVNELNQGQFIVDSIKRANTKSHAPAPFTTSTMQQDASNKLGMTLKRTTTSAQELYEGVNIAGEGKIALITYIRTDSTRVSSDAQNACLAFVRENYGDKYVPAKPNIYATKANAQDAHEAIRPINMKMTPEMVKESLSSDNYKLYKLIYERFLASQMAEAEYFSVTANIKNGDYSFKATGKTLNFPGYTAVYKEYTDDEKQEISKLPPLEEKEVVSCEKINSEQKFTKPPARYTEGSLVKAMEEKGIGRPATYAATITVLSSREYTQKEGKYLVPTDLGRKVIDYLDEHFSSVINVKFTAHMENRLDDIATKGEEWKNVVESFWEGFSGLLKKVGGDTSVIKEEIQETDIVCPKCGNKMVIRSGRYGKFLGCSNFPKCKNIMPMPEEDNKKKAAGICPECGKEVFARKSKTGKLFYSCSGYPDCKFMSWYPPTGEKCPKCNGYLVVRGKKIVCSENGCDYVKEISQSQEN